MRCCLLWVAALFFVGCPKPQLPASAGQELFCSLDYGLYWFGPEDQAARYDPSVKNPYYDASKPTVIYVHGWEPGTTTKGFRETFRFEKGGAGATKDWTSANWNIGIFYWNQFSDETNVWDAEAKIWTSESDVKMRWRDCKGRYQNEGAPTESAAELLVASLMALPREAPLRLVGHSLGNQMVTRASWLLLEKINRRELSAEKLPARIALLDPYWSKGEKKYLGGETNGARVFQYAKALAAQGVGLELYRSSDLVSMGFGAVNEPLRQLAAYVELSPGYVWKVDQGARHVAARDWYFLSQRTTPSACQETASGCISAGEAPSAALSDETLRRFMQAPYYWQQQTGEKTPTPTDDAFTLKPR
jgi:hypothetical protein